MNNVRKSVETMRLKYYTEIHIKNYLLDVPF